jgi:creatinine amidohydrolase
VRKLVIFNTHGGQRALVDLVAMRLRAECAMLVARATYFALGVPPGVFDAAEAAHDIHGGEVETSLLLHLAPQLVRTAAIADFKGLPHELAKRNRVLGVEKPVGIGWRSEDLHPSGACGNATRADADKGAKHLAHVAERLAVLVGELAATPLSTLK